MLDFAHKQRVYPRNFICTVFAVLLLALPVAGQDTIQFPAVEISAPKTDLGLTGKKRETVDSIILTQYRFNSIASVLNEQSVVHVKSYGPGGLSTTALRGGNASQTALVWNGINIQNMMLGQTDLSVLPAMAFDQMDVEYGASSALWGSGAVSGSLLLGNKSKFGQGLNVAVSAGAGSFGAWNNNAKVSFSKQRFVSSTRIYRQVSQNNYAYKDTLDDLNPIKTASHAAFDFKGLLQEFRFLSGKNSVSLNYWYSANQRQIPIFTGVESQSSQDDNASRLVANYKYNGNKILSSFNLAWLNETLLYEDQTINSRTKSKINTVIAESDNYYHWQQHVFNFGANATLSEASSDNYTGVRDLQKVSVIAGNKFSFLEKRLSVLVNTRLEYFSAGTLPFTWNVAADYLLNAQWTLKLNVAKVYRQPTFNELYWQPGGNPNLNPESGYSGEGAISYQKKWQTFSLFFSGAAFSRIIDNWILWVPGPNGNSTPMNLQQVWSRGTESTTKLSRQKNKLLTEFVVRTSYVLSTNQKSEQENDATVDRQLVYTPRYTVNGHLLLAWKRLQLTLLEQYNGYRFTSTDNTQWLMPYFVSSAKMSTQFGKQRSIEFSASCNNIFDNNYALIAGRPMPLRNYEASIRLYFNHINTKKQIQ